MKGTGMPSRGVELDQPVRRGNVVHKSYLILTCALPTSTGAQL